MSSKIITGKAARDAERREWRAFHASGAPAAKQNQSQQSEQLLASRIRDLETAAENRAREAYQQGRREAEQQMAERIEPVIQRYAAGIQDLIATRSLFRREAEEDTVMLAVAIARKLLQREIAVDPESLLGLVKAAVQRIDAREIHRIRVNPEDARTLEQALHSPVAQRKIEILPDPGLERGAIIIETSRGNLDASIETQLKEIERGFLGLVRAKR
jgi:flagellar assembly protein FliH